MTEELHRPNITRGTRAVCLAAILAVICLVGGAGSYLNRVLDTAVFDYVTILLLSVSAWAAYRWLIVEYRYRVEDHVLYIDVVSGKRSRTLRSVKSSSVTEIRRAKRPYPVWGRYDVWNEKEPLTEVVYTEGNSSKTILLAAGEGILRELREKTEPQAERKE